MDAPAHTEVTLIEVAGRRRRYKYAEPLTEETLAVAVDDATGGASGPRVERILLSRAGLLDFVRLTNSGRGFSVTAAPAAPAEPAPALPAGTIFFAYHTTLAPVLDIESIPPGEFAIDLKV